MNNKKIFDCFRFFNEKELLELRYHILRDHVDKFIILQGNKTQSGNPCELLAEKYITELNLPREKFIIVNVELPSNNEYVDTKEEDIVFRQLSGQSNDTYQNSVNARSRERILLDSLLTIVKDQSDSDVFLISDCDEIIKPEYIDWFTNTALQYPNQLIKIPLVELQGRANLRAYSSETNQPVSTDHVFYICTKKHFEKCTPFRMRFNINNPFEIAYITQDGNRVEDCGWHFSWIGDSNRLKLKQKSTSHYADQIESATIKDMGSKEIETYIADWTPETGTNVWGDTKTILKDYPKTNLPKQMIELDHLKKFFLDETMIYITEDKISSNTIERTDIINTLIQKIDAKKYLEIGVSIGQNLASINCEYKIGVDPNVNSPATFHITSDEFFEKNQETFDVIFIDGLHHADQVLKDILNSLDILNDGGYIICHDMNPIREEHQLTLIKEGTWNGDCWKAHVHLRNTRNDLTMFVVDTDHGCGIIQKGCQDTINIDGVMTYQNFDKNRKEWLNLITVEEFCSKINLNKKNTPIPVLGIPIVNGVHWLKRLIDSIDYPVKELFIVNNNGRDQITDELNQLVNINHPFVEEIRVCHLPSNLGVGGAWNLIIKSYLMSPYWIICNNDVAFTPGFLKEMVDKIKNNDVEIAWPPSVNHNYTQNGLGSFECFLIKDSVVQKCGLFDENLYPAYCEDCDYLVKIKSNNIKSEFVYSSFYHGETESYETGSQTLKSESSEIGQKIHDAHIKNIQYMNNVWGNDWENWKDYSSKNITIQPKFYDINFNRQKYLGF